MVGVVLVLRWQFRPRQQESSVTRPELEIAARDSSSIDSDLETKPLAISDVLEIARELKADMEANVSDYTAKMIKRERIHGRLRDEDTMQIKIRHAQSDAQPPVPFGAYLVYVPPSSLEGREVIWVDGQNDGKLLTHQFGLNLKLPPDGLLAMNGNRYPVTSIGMLTLAEKLIEKGELDRDRSDCKIEIVENQVVEQRPCKLIQITNPEKVPEVDYHVAQIYIDNELGVPIRYASYSWPTQRDPTPQLEEEYTYLDLKINVGLTDADFDPKNSEYKFPK